MGVDKSFYQRLFRVPVAPVGTNIHKKDDLSWLQPSADGPPEIAYPAVNGDEEDPYTHPYDRAKKAKETDKSSTTSSSGSVKGKSRKGDRQQE
ncbi:hypothetical protein MPH_03644 [Macrophomina phaseolina MS6]|uniref:Uncharacterized protein n=2 Tax=Macrophomina phaseolina TaxID=35725 RepID=K2RWI8_MACPH|nr:hypothetical protein MPH_03644 [Macrophomina phaseolina MS6]KAH7054351.1 hypothetical protein B0J12DRAFT_738890 [Macrophomina phaseolina]